MACLNLKRNISTGSLSGIYRSVKSILRIYLHEIAVLLIFLPHLPATAANIYALPGQLGSFMHSFRLNIQSKELSVWEEYKWHILGALVLCIIQSLLIYKLISLQRVLKSARQSAQERHEFEALLAELSAAFVYLPAGEVDQAIEQWLVRLRLFLGVDQILIAEFTPDQTQYYITHSTFAPETEKYLKNIDRNMLPWYTRQILSEINVVLSRIPDDLPSEASAERQYCRENGLKSNLSIPLSIRGSSIGVLVFSSFRTYRPWPQELVSSLQFVGESFANAIARKRAEEALRAALAEVSELKNKLQAEIIYLQEEIKLTHNFDEIIGNSDALKYALYKVEQVSATDTTVLILGETGTGKELIARAIHQASTRRDRPLVKVNCTALPANLIESELFGHEKGAFTGAQSRKIGRFELADRGTLFLDEVGELPLELQPKLLRILQDGEFERVGGSKTLKVDVRIIAATNRNLQLEVPKGLFREDLWYRLNVFPITLPPLCNRKEDISMLVNFFINQFNRKIGRNVRSVDPATMKALQNHSWPGNIRELSNVIERAVINTEGSVLQLADKLESPPEPGDYLMNTKSFEELEREIILQRLKQTNWKISGPGGAANSLGLNPSTLRTRMIKLGIQRAENHL